MSKRQLWFELINGRWDKVPNCHLFKIKINFDGFGERRAISHLLVLNLLLTFSFLSTMSAPGDTFYLTTPTKFWIHNMPEDHQSCPIPFSRDSATIIKSLPFISNESSFGRVEGMNMKLLVSDCRWRCDRGHWNTDSKEETFTKHLESLRWKYY